MSRTWRSLGVAALVLGAGAMTPAAAQTAPTFTKDIAPIFQEKCEACHRPDSIAPMSLVTYEEARPWARSIKTRVDDASDAAVAHRQDGRHSEVQERSLAERRADRDDRAVGRRRRAEGRSEGHAGRRAVADRAGLELRRACSARPSPTSSSAPRRGRRRPARTTPGGSRSSRRASPSRAGCARSKSARPPSRAARSRITRSRASSRTRPIALAQNGRRPATGDARRRRHVHGMGRRQAGRDHAAEQPAS